MTNADRNAPLALEWQIGTTPLFTPTLSDDINNIQTKTITFIIPWDITIISFRK